MRIDNMCQEQYMGWFQITNYFNRFNIMPNKIIFGEEIVYQD